MLLSPVHCAWQVVKTPTIILNNPAFRICDEVRIILDFAEVKKNLLVSLITL